MLSEFRDRLIKGGLEKQLFEQMLDVFQEKELLKLQKIIPDAQWYSRSGQRFQESRLPSAKNERKEWATRQSNC